MKLMTHAFIALALTFGLTMPALANWEAIPSAVVCARTDSELNGILYAHSEGVWIELAIGGETYATPTGGNPRPHREHRKVLAPFEIVQMVRADEYYEMMGNVGRICVIVRTLRR